MMAMICRDLCFLLYLPLQVKNLRDHRWYAAILLLIQRPTFVSPIILYSEQDGMAYLRMVMREAETLPINMVSKEAQDMKAKSSQQESSGYLKKLSPIAEAPSGFAPSVDWENDFMDGFEYFRNVRPPNPLLLFPHPSLTFLLSAFSALNIIRCSAFFH